MPTEVKKYTKEEREQVLQEVKDTGNAALVARNRGIAYHTVASWVRLERLAPKQKRRQELQDLEKRLKNAELENRILKELLKKTNQLWLTDEQSAISSSGRGSQWRR
jgi:transposase-like protein